MARRGTLLGIVHRTPPHRQPKPPFPIHPLWRGPNRPLQRSTIPDLPGVPAPSPSLPDVPTVTAACYPSGRKLPPGPGLLAPCATGSRPIRVTPAGRPNPVESRPARHFLSFSAPTSENQPRFERDTPREPQNRDHTAPNNSVAPPVPLPLMPGARTGLGRGGGASTEPMNTRSHNTQKRVYVKSRLTSCQIKRSTYPFTDLSIKPVCVRGNET